MISIDSSPGWEINGIGCGAQNVNNFEQTAVDSLPINTEALLIVYNYKNFKLKQPI